MSAAVTTHRSVMPACTLTTSGTRLCSRSSLARTGAGATSMRSMSEDSEGTTVPRHLVGKTRGFDEARDTVGANPWLSEVQISALAAYGERRKVAAGEVLFQEGGSWADLFVVLSAEVAIVGGYQGPDERLIVIY